jgi:ricin-type beta-trefoil lectin protein
MTGLGWAGQQPERTPMRPTLDANTLTLMHRPVADTLAPPRRRKRRLCSAIAAAVALASLIGASAAQAQPLTSVAISAPGYLTLDVAGGSTAAGAGVITWYGHGGANQRWNFVELRNGNQQIVNQKSGMCLTTDGVAGHRVYQLPCHQWPGQEWSGTLPNVFASPGFFLYGAKLQNPASKLVLDIQGGSRAAGTPLIVWYSNDGSNQRFKYFQLG